MSNLRNIKASYFGKKRFFDYFESESRFECVCMAGVRLPRQRTGDTVCIVSELALFAA